MAAGSISQYFDSKSRLLMAVLTHLADEFEQYWREAVVAAGDEPGQRLAAFVGSYFSTQLCQRRKIAVWFAFWGEVKAEPQYRAVCTGYDSTHDQMLESLCADLIVAGGYTGRSPRITSKLVASICHGLWLEFLTGQERLRRTDLSRLAAEGLAALFPAHGPMFAAALGGAEPE
jgi:TetR/AcrR family transcriptional repressor of bet genes